MGAVVAPPDPLDQPGRHLREHPRGRRETYGAAARRRREGPAVPKVMIAEDHRALRALIRLTLQGGRFEIVEATDGPAALTLAQRVRPDLVFLDWGMPGLSGLDVARALRGDPATRHARIVMVTARERPDERAAALSSGVDDFMSKPFSPLRLLEAVSESLGAEALA